VKIWGYASFDAGNAWQAEAAARRYFRAAGLRACAGSTDLPRILDVWRVRETGQYRVQFVRFA